MGVQLELRIAPWRTRVPAGMIDVPAALLAAIAFAVAGAGVASVNRRLRGERDITDPEAEEASG